YLAPPASMHKFPFFKEPIAVSSSACSAVSSTSTLMTSNPLPFAFNEEDEDEEENEDELYRNFVDSQDQPMSAVVGSKGTALLGAAESTGPNGVFSATASYSQ